MMASMSGHKPAQSTDASIASGMANTFKDLMSLKQFDAPIITVSEPTLKGGSHHVYKVKGCDHLG
jgi:hypothetical protein